jgi:hypothetical protein
MKWYNKRLKLYIPLFLMMYTHPQFVVIYQWCRMHRCMWRNPLIMRVFVLTFQRTSILRIALSRRHIFRTSFFSAVHMRHIVQTAACGEIVSIQDYCAEFLRRLQLKKISYKESSFPESLFFSLSICQARPKHWRMWRNLNSRQGVGLTFQMPSI